MIFLEMSIGRAGALCCVLRGLRRPFLNWISEFPTHRISMSVNHWHPKPALNPERSKKEETLSEPPYLVLPAFHDGYYYQC
jgi:hypothetical protein